MLAGFVILSHLPKLNIKAVQKKNSCLNSLTKMGRNKKKRAIK